MSIELGMESVVFTDKGMIEAQRLLEELSR